MRERPAYTLRRAVEADQPTIRRMVLSECLNPRDVHWQNFLIAEDEAERRIIGIGQIRLHGTLKELGSLVIAPEYRGLGLGAALIEALETRAGFPLYLMCAGDKVSYYRRFGYQPLADADIPASILPRWVLWIVRHIFRSQVAVMLKEG
ncbi:MAG: GNAT family N-acetyltransferase [Anaerolineae bacterium]|nr:GNAT family N-acetyltransferase [Anaerolineae bacterium]